MVRELKLMRIDKGLTQREVAQAIGVGQQSVNNWERGLRIPRPDSMFKLAKLYDVEPRELLSVFDNNKSLTPHQESSQEA